MVDTGRFTNTPTPLPVSARMNGARQKASRAINAVEALQNIFGLLFGRGFVKGELRHVNARLMRAQDARRGNGIL